jgi:hypothetical protein
VELDVGGDEGGREFGVGGGSSTTAADLRGDIVDLEHRTMTRGTKEHARGWKEEQSEPKQGVGREGPGSGLE